MPLPLYKLVWCNNHLSEFWDLDPFLQGRLVEKDIDIRPTDDDTTVRPVQREYKAHVTENYLEIHLFWAGKGTFTIPNIGTCGPLISTISAKPGITTTG